MRYVRDEVWRSLTIREKQLCELIGTKNRKSKKFLKLFMQTSEREVRRYVESCRRKGVPIHSDTFKKGYLIDETRVKDITHEYKKRINTMAKTIASLENTNMDQVILDIKKDQH